MTYLKRLGVLLAGAMAVAACGGGDSISIDDLPAELEAALCGRYVRCGYYGSTAACEQDLTSNIVQIQHAIDAGRVAYDGEQAATCVDALGSAACDTSTESSRVTPAACDQAIRGTVADNGTCYASQECVSESCNLPGCGMACCQGTCDPTVVEVAIGQSCASADCVAGAFCNTANVCAALLTTGAACDGNSECDYGLTCPDGTCVAAANRGEACPDGECADLGDRCNAAMSCVALSGIGGECSMGFFGTFDCQRPLVCNQTSLKCENPPAVGQACQFFCAGDAFCNDQDVCQAPQAIGAQCGGNDECASRYCNEAVTPAVCAELPICG